MYSVCPLVCAVSSVQKVGDEEEVAGRACRHRAMDSILFNIRGRLFLMQQDLPVADQFKARQQVRRERDRGGRVIMSWLKWGGG